MSFDFYQEYKDYSNIDLLKILKRPGDYQPSAVEAATKVLNERVVTPDEMEFVDQYYQEIEDNTKVRKEKIDTYKNKATSFFEPVIKPSENIEPGKWLNILLLVMALQYAWTLFNTIKELISFLQCAYCKWDVIYFFEILILLYVPLIFFLLFRRRRWGWILLFADNLFTLIGRFGQSYVFFKYQSIHLGDTTSFLLPILVRAAFVFFLWRDSIADHFGVTYETKKRTATITTIAAIFMVLILYFFMYEM